MSGQAEPYETATSVLQTCSEVTQFHPGRPCEAQLQLQRRKQESSLVWGHHFRSLGDTVVLPTLNPDRLAPSTSGPATFRLTLGLHGGGGSGGGHSVPRGARAEPVPQGPVEGARRSSPSAHPRMAAPFRTQDLPPLARSRGHAAITALGPAPPCSCPSAQAPLGSRSLWACPLVTSVLDAPHCRQE